jgi:hypothetical protein
VTTDGQGREWYTSVSYEHVRLDPTKITGEQWVLIGERYYREDGAWLWGWPRPGLPGCPMPDEIQSLYRKSAPEVTKGAKQPRTRIDLPEPLEVAESIKPTKFEFETFLATIAGKYVQAQLCPPVRLRDFAADLLASGISPEHCRRSHRRHGDRAAGRPPGG